jgi:hypothetical protein
MIMQMGDLGNWGRRKEERKGKKRKGFNAEGTAGRRVHTKTKTKKVPTLTKREWGIRYVRLVE